MAEHNEIGKIGENIAKSFLMKHGFTIIESNYRTKYGELDIVAKKDRKLRIVEVKSIKVRDMDAVQSLPVRPEDNLTGEKWRKIAISSEIYLRNTGVTHGTPWQIDLACVYVDTEKREGKVVLMENIHKE